MIVEHSWCGVPGCPCGGQPDAKACSECELDKHYGIFHQDCPHSTGAELTPELDPPEPQTISSGEWEVAGFPFEAWLRYSQFGREGQKKVESAFRKDYQEGTQ